jgi:hypothetical protein
MLKIKKLLYTRNLEDYYGHKWIFNIIILCFMTFLSTGDLNLRLVAHLLTLFWISINTCQLNTLFKRKKCEFIFCQSPISYDSRFIMLLKSSIIENTIFAIFIMLHLVFFMHANIYNALIITVVHFFFAIAIGTFCSQLSNQSLGLILITLFYVSRFYMGSWWTSDEHSRYVSPTIQLYNVHIINVINTFSLIIQTIILLLLSKLLLGVYKKFRGVKTAGLIGLCIILFIGIISYELTFNKEIEESAYRTITMNQKLVKFKGVDEKSATELTNLLIALENETTKLGLESSQSREYHINKYYISYLQTLYKTRPIPVNKEEDIIYINIFSDAMTNFKEINIVRDIMFRVYDQIEIEENDALNNYVHQIIDGCREHVFKSVYENNLNIISKEFVEMCDREIEDRDKSVTTQSNFLKKIVNYMFEKYPEDIHKLYSIVRSEDPKNNEELIEIFDENFQEILADCKIQNIIKSVNRSK